MRGDPIDSKDVYDFSLSIKDCQVADSGEWCCEVIHPNGTISSFCNVKIFEEIPDDEKPPWIIKPLESLSTDGSDDVHLQCQIVGNPCPDITWQHDGKDLENDARHKISYTDDGLCSLLVSPFIPHDDKGLFRCTASNTTGSATTEGVITISVKEEPKPEPIVQKPKTKIVKRLEKVTVKKTIYERKLKPQKIEELGDKSAIVQNDQNGISEIYLREFYKNDFIDTSILKQLIGWEEEDTLYFPIHLKNKCAVDGSRVVLNCMVSGVSPFKIRWLKDGNELEDTEKYYIKSFGGLQCVELIEVTFDDTGQYTCEVTNKQGQITSSCYLQVEPVFDPHIEYQQPKIVRHLQNLSIGKGLDAMLVCAAKGTPMPGFKWYKDSRALHESDRISMSFDEIGVAILSIKDVQYYDKGLYTCEAHNLAGRSKTAANINVRDNKGPAYENVPVEIEVEEDREVEVEVEATPDPEPEPPKYQADTLCQVETKSAVKARTPDFTIQLPKVLEIKDGKRLFLRCHADGYPTPKVSWLKDDKPLGNSDTISLLSLGSWHGLEIVETSYKYHSGHYSAIAENEAASNKTTCFVEILAQGKPGEIYLSPEKKEIIPPSNDLDVVLTQTCLYGEVFLIPALVASGLVCHASPLTVPTIESVCKYRESPHFTQELKPSYHPLEIDDNFTIECVIAGVPTPHIVWYHDGAIVQNTRNVRMEWDPVTHRAAIVIRFMHILDTGRYQCLAYSENGHATTTTEVHMKRLDMLIERIDQVAEEDMTVRELSCPEFTGKLHDRIVQEGDLVRLECVTDGIPPPTVRWLKDDKELFSYGNVMIRSEGPLHQLEILDVSLNDHGYYMCEAKSSEGRASTRAQLTVEGAEEGEISDVEYGRPSFLESIHSISVPAGLEAILSCVVRGNPRPKLRWQKDNTDLFQSDRLQTSLTKTGEAKLRIKNVQKSDAGMYICVARNRAGRVKATATIRVTEKRRMTWSGDALELPPSLNLTLLRPRSGSMNPSAHHMGGSLFHTGSDDESMPLIEEDEEKDEEETVVPMEEPVVAEMTETLVEEEECSHTKQDEPIAESADNQKADENLKVSTEVNEDAVDAETDPKTEEKEEKPKAVKSEPEDELAPKPDVIPKELPPPVFIVRPKSQWSVAKKDFRMSVKIRATSKPEVKWMKDGHCVTYSDHYVIVQ